MSTNEKDVEHLTSKTPTFKTIDYAVYSLTGTVWQGAAAAVAVETQSGRVERLVQIYTAVKPMMLAFGALPIIPHTWKNAVALLISALDAVAGGVDPNFKAGKDL